MTSPLAADDFFRLADVSRETRERLQLYSEDLATWQKAHNLVANSTLKDMWRRHFLDSSQLLSLFRAQETANEPLDILDLGAGAGFPGLVLAIIGGNTEIGTVHLAESNGKKCAFLRHVARRTAAPVIVHQCRIQDLPPLQVDIVTARALARVTALLRHGTPYLKPSGAFWLLKGETAGQELTEAAANWHFEAQEFDSQSDQSGIVLRLTGARAR